jgi:hypothetical protein
MAIAAGSRDRFCKSAVFVSVTLSTDIEVCDGCAGSDDVTDDPIREIDAAVVLQARSDLHHFYTYHSESVHPESRAKFEQLLFLFIRNHSEIIYHNR